MGYHSRVRLTFSLRFDVPETRDKSRLLVASFAQSVNSRLGERWVDRLVRATGRPSWTESLVFAASCPVARASGVDPRRCPVLERRIAMPGLLDALMAQDTETVEQVRTQTGVDRKRRSKLTAPPSARS